MFSDNQSLPTPFLIQLSVWAFLPFFFERLTFEDWTETSVSIYQSTLCKIPEERTCNNTVYLQPQTSNSKQTGSTNRDQNNTRIIQSVAISSCGWAVPAWYCDVTFWIRQSNCGYHNIQNVSWSAERLLAFNNTYIQNGRVLASIF
jgi:hypothetical protein